MNKKEVKQKLLIVSFNKIKDLILVDKIDEAQAALEMLTAQLKEIDNIYPSIEAISFDIGNFVTLDDPEAREVIDINSYRDICYLDNIYKITDMDDHYIYLIAIKNRDGASGTKTALLWHSPKEMERMAKLNIKSPSVKADLYKKV